MPSLGAYGVVLAVVAATTFASMFVVRRLAFRIGAVVRPDDRRVHQRPTATLGGLAMLVGLLVGMGVAWSMGAFDQVFESNTEPLGLVLAAVVIVGVGVIDDLREVSAPAKIAGIVLAASVLVISGISMLVFRVPFLGVFVLSSDWSYLLSVLWVVGMANAINLIDGLDGLAGGIVAIAAGAFFLYSIELGNEGLLAPGNIGALIAVVTLGACLGFLPHNIHPARIFMGDGGALLLGLLMAASTMVVGGRTDRSFSGSSFFFFAPILIPVVILGVPIIDTLVRHHPEGAQPVGHLDRRQGPPAPPAHAPRPRSPAQRVHPVGLDRAALGLRALPDLQRLGRRRRAVRHRRDPAAALHVPAPRTAHQARRGRSGR